MNFILADLVSIDEVKQIAVIKLVEDGNRQIGVNLWEVVGYVRNSDQFSSWKYALTGE